MKTSSILTQKTFEISKASFSDGLYFHISRKTIVSLLTHTLFANSCWVRLCFALSSLILFFILFFLFKVMFSLDDVCSRHKITTLKLRLNIVNTIKCLLMVLSLRSGKMYLLVLSYMWLGQIFVMILLVLNIKLFLSIRLWSFYLLESIGFRASGIMQSREEMSL